MHSISSNPAGDLEKQQQDKAQEKQSESVVHESAKEVNHLTIVVCNGDSSGARETVELAQIYGPAAEREESPKKVCLSRNSSSHEQCRSAPLPFFLLRRFHECKLMYYKSS